MGRPRITAKYLDGSNLAISYSERNLAYLSIMNMAQNKRLL